MSSRRAEVLTQRRLGRATLARQMLLERVKVPVPKAVERLAGMQAQQARPPFVGLWTRLEGFAREDLVRAIAEREVVRATMMRVTLHLVSAADYCAFRAALQPALTQGMQGALRDAWKTLDVGAAVAVGREHFASPRSFDALRTFLKERDAKCNERALAYAVRTHLPLVQVPADDAPWAYPGAADFTLAESWLAGRPLASEARTAELAQRYLAAFGPATPADMVTWSGLPGPIVRAAFEQLGSKLRAFRDDRGRELFDLASAPRPDEEEEAPVRFLPDFDNLVLGHADRTRIIDDAHRPKVVTKNLQVLATFLVDGRVAGTWRTERKKSAATLVCAPFGKLARPAKKALAEEGEALLRFLEPDAATLGVKVP